MYSGYIHVTWTKTTTTYVSGLRTFTFSFCTNGTDVCHIYMRLDIYLKVLEFLKFGCITLPVYSGRILHTDVWYFRLDTRQFNLMLSPSPLNRSCSFMVTKQYIVLTTTNFYSESTFNDPESVAPLGM